MAHKLAGMPVQEQDIIDVQTLVDAYFDNAPDVIGSDTTRILWYIWSSWYLFEWYLYRFTCSSYYAGYL